jgi:hypothetical protein
MSLRRCTGFAGASPLTSTTRNGSSQRAGYKSNTSRGAGNGCERTEEEPRALADEGHREVAEVDSKPVEVIARSVSSKETFPEQFWRRTLVETSPVSEKVQ